MICNKCGAQINDNAQFCTSCGSAVERQAPAPVQTNQQANNGYQAPDYGYGYQQPQPTHQTVYVNQQPSIHMDEHVSVGGWIGRWLLLMLPIVNIVMLFVWAFGGTRQYSLKTWARAQLILTLIFVVLAVIAYVIMLILGAGVASYINY